MAKMLSKLSKSTRIYTDLVLKMYNIWVLRISNKYAWRCPTKEVLLPFFRENISSQHIDVGVGTGYYLSHVNNINKLTLLDANPNCLEYVKKNLTNRHIENLILHDVKVPFPKEIQKKYGSVSCFYLLHCLSGDKRSVIENLSTLLNEKGVLYGATILGKAVNHNVFGKKLMSVYNEKGIFGNMEDSLQDFKEIFESYFGYVEFEMRGKVMLFSAREPIL